MDRRLLDHYNRELGHLREMGAEFAAEFPKIAARLGMHGGEVVLDPYVERLLEGTAFLAARVQLKLDAEFPRFTQHLLEMLHPHYLAPTPSMLIAQFRPVLGDANLAAGSLLPRGTVIRNLPGRTDGVACEFRTGRDLVLWPLELGDARYFSVASDLPLDRLALAARACWWGRRACAPGAHDPLPRHDTGRSRTGSSRCGSTLRRSWPRSWAPWATQTWPSSARASRAGPAPACLPACPPAARPSTLVSLPAAADLPVRPPRLLRLRCGCTGC